MSKKTLCLAPHDIDVIIRLLVAVTVGILCLLVSIAPAAAIPLTPDGGTGYTVSGSEAGGDISYTITAAGEYELVNDLATTAETAITIAAGGGRTIIINGNSHTIGGNTTSLTATINGGTLMDLTLNDIVLKQDFTTAGLQGGTGVTGATGWSGDKSSGPGYNGGSGGAGGSFKISLINVSCEGRVHIAAGVGGTGGTGGAGGTVSSVGTTAAPVSPGKGGLGGNGGTGGSITMYILNTTFANNPVYQTGNGGTGGTGGSAGRTNGGNAYIPDGSTGGTGGTGGLLTIEGVGISLDSLSSSAILGTGGTGGYGTRSNVRTISGGGYPLSNGGHGGTGGAGGSLTLKISDITLNSPLSISAGVGGTGGSHEAGIGGGTTGGNGGTGAKGKLINSLIVNLNTNHSIITQCDVYDTTIQSSTFTMSYEVFAALEIHGNVLRSKIETSSFSISKGDAIYITPNNNDAATISLISNTFHVSNGYIVNLFFSGTPNTQTSVYNNYFNATNYFRDTRGYKFYTDLTPGTNIMGGSFIGGNYWTNPAGTGYSDNPPSTIFGGFSFNPYNGDNYPLVKNPDHPSQTPNTITSESPEILTGADDRYSAKQQYTLPTNPIDLAYLDAQTAILATGNSIYKTTGSDLAVAPVTTNTGAALTKAYISTETAAAINTAGTVIIYPYTGPTATAIYQSTTQPTAVSQTSQITAYTAPVDSNTYLILHNTSTGTYLTSTQTTDTHLSANNNTNLILGHSGTTTLNIYRWDSTAIAKTTATIPSAITDIKEISGTDNIIITTTAKTYIYTLTTSGTATLLITSTETNPLSHPSGTITNNIIATYQNNLYIIDQTGTTIGTYAAGAQLNAVDISRRSGLWAVAGGVDNQIYFLTKSSSSGWYLEQTTLAMDAITHAAMGTTGYYALVAVGTTLTLFTQGGLGPDPGQTTTYWLNGIVINTNGAPYVGPISVSGTTLTTDTTGKFVMKVTPGTTYTITAGTTTTQYTATNVQYQTVAIRIQPDPYATNIDYSATWNNTAQAIELSYTDKTGRTDSVTWRIRNTATNDVVYQQSAPSGQTISYSIPAEQQYTNYQVSMSADRTNAAGTDTQVSNTWMITPSGSSPLALPLDNTGKNILFTGVLMIFAALFGVMHSTKGAIAITALAAMMRYLELVTIPWIVIIIAMAIAILAALAKGGGGK